MLNKSRIILWWIAVGVAALLIVSSGVAKLVGTRDVVSQLTQRHPGTYTAWFGVIEIILVLLFLIPKTTHVGFALLSSYLIGTFAASLYSGEPTISPPILLLMVWIGSLLRHSQFNLKKQRTQV